MRYLHTMIRASDLDKALEFFVSHLGLVEVRRKVLMSEAHLGGQAPADAQPFPPAAHTRTQIR